MYICYSFTRLLQTGNRDRGGSFIFEFFSLTMDINRSHYRASFSLFLEMKNPHETFVKNPASRLLLWTLRERMKIPCRSPHFPPGLPITDEEWVHLAAAIVIVLWDYEIARGDDGPYQLLIGLLD